MVAKSAPSSKSYPQRRNNRSRSHKARSVTKTVSRSTARTSSHLRIPPPPSRSPTPPTVVAPADSTRNWFTVAEEQFFIKSIQWQLKQNPRISIQTIASTLAEKVVLKCCLLVCLADLWCCRCRVILPSPGNGFYTGNTDKLFRD